MHSVIESTLMLLTFEVYIFQRLILMYLTKLWNHSQVRSPISYLKSYLRTKCCSQIPSNVHRKRGSNRSVHPEEIFCFHKLVASMLKKIKYCRKSWNIPDEDKIHSPTFGCVSEVNSQSKPIRYWKGQTWKHDLCIFETKLQKIIRTCSERYSTICWKRFSSFTNTILSFCKDNLWQELSSNWT